MRLSGWKTADLGCHSIFSNRIDDICLRSSPCRKQISDVSQFQNMYYSRKIHKKILSGSIDSYISIFEFGSDKNYQIIRIFKSNHSIIDNYINNNSIYVMNIDKLPFSLLKCISEKNGKFIIFTNDHPKFGTVVKQKPSNWHQGIVFHSEYQIIFNNSYALTGNLYKIYISKWAETLYLLTNIDDMEIDIINKIVESLPKDFRLL